MIILSGNCPRHHNAIMLELTDFDDSKISYLARGHHVDTLLVPREYKDTFEFTELHKILLPIMIDVRRTLENLHQILPDLSIEDLFRVLDNIVEIPQFNVGQTTTIRRDDSGWRPYDTGTFISYASNGITLSDEGTCK